jgi:hypothetical protein
MKYKNFVKHMMYLMSFNIFCSLKEAANPTSPLLVSQKSNTYQSISNFSAISNFQENKKIKNSMGKYQSFKLPEEIQQTIMKLRLLLQCKDEYIFLETISPVKIGNKQLWVMDLWRLTPEKRNRALSYHAQSTFNLKECDELKKIIPQEIKQDMEIHRFATNDELYDDCFGFPGGWALIRCMVPPALGGSVTVLGGLLVAGVAHPLLDYSQSFAISGGIGSVMTMAGWGMEYWRYRWMLANNTVAMALKDV